MRYKADRYAHERQFKRMRRVLKRQRTIGGRLQHEITRKLSAIGQAVSDALGTILAKARQIWEQTAGRKTKNGKAKLYSWHAPEVQCINLRLERQPFEFGTKVGIANTHKHKLIFEAKAFSCRPLDGHTHNPQLVQATILMQDSGVKPVTAYVDLGYRGVEADKTGVPIKHRGKRKQLNAEELTVLKRGQAIEPVIGHLKQDHRLDRCHLKGEQCDRLHAVLCAAGFNFSWQLRMIAK